MLKYLFVFLAFVVVFSGCSSNNARYITDGKEIDYIKISPVDVTVPKGFSGDYTAIAYLNDGSTNDVSDRVIWESSNEKVVTFNVTQNNTANAVGEGSSSITAHIEDIYSDTALITVTPAKLISLELAPVKTSVAKGVDVKYSLIGIYSDKTSSDLTKFANFSSSNTSVATISSDGAEAGFAKTLSTGITNIKATFEGLTSNNAILNVTSATITSIQITPADASVPIGTTGTYTAIAYYSDNASQDVTEKATWVSENPSIVEIRTGSDESGYAEALAVGNTTITASYDGVISNIASVEVTNATLVSIQVSPVLKSVANGIDVSYKAIGIFSDNSNVNLTLFATWNSSDESVATFLGRGGASGKAFTANVGETNVTATFMGITSNTATLEVTNATVASIQVTPADASVPKGTTGTYTAIAYYSDNTSQDVTKQATWISADDTIVSVVTTGDNAGDAIALNIGNTTISASYDGTASNEASVEVTDISLTGVQIIAHDTVFPRGTEVDFIGLAHYGTDYNDTEIITSVGDWKSLDTSIATVEFGHIVAVGVGTTTIQLSFEGKVDTQVIEVIQPPITDLLITPQTYSVSVGGVVQYNATATYSDGTTKDVTQDVRWESLDINIAFVKNLFSIGEAVGLTEGTTSIKAYYEGVEVGNTTTLEVIASIITLDTIVVTPADETITKESYLEYVATGYYSDGHTADITYDVTWASSNLSVATIGDVEGIEDGDSIAYAIGDGVTTISATLDSVSGNTSLTVSGDCGSSRPASIEIIPAVYTMSIGEIKQFHLKGTWSNGCEREITFDPAAVWNSDDEDTVSMRSKGGEAIAHKPGSVPHINAKYKSGTSTATVDVE